MERGPGTYKDPLKFGDEARDMTIQGPRRDGPKNDVPGPGSYIHEAADGTTKYTAPAWTIPERPRDGSIRMEDITNGPGEYNEHRNFGDNLNNMQIGHRRDPNLPVTAGPGEYNHERADS
jgi:hypothetical protein